MPQPAPVPQYIAPPPVIRQEAPASVPQSPAAPPVPKPAAPEPQPAQRKLPTTPAEAVIFLAQEGIPDCRIQEEDTPDMLKIHIYYSNNQKFGIVKVFKADGTMQLRKLAGGAPQNYFLSCANDLKKYI